MLSNMRKRVRIIMIVVAVAFVAGFLLGELWSVLRSRGETRDPRTRGILARVGDHNVTAEEMRGAIAYTTERYRQENSLRDLSTQDYEAIENRAWQWLVSELTWRKLFDKTGVTATYDEVLEIMRSNPPEELLQDPSLRDSAGEFNHQLYIQAMESEQNRAYFSRYFQELAEMLPKEKLRIDMSNSFRVTSGDLEHYRRTEGERVAVTALFLGPQALESPVEPTDEEAKKYFNANPDEFKPRAMRHLAYIHFPLRLSETDSADAAAGAERARVQLEGGESFNLTMLDFTDLVPDTVGGYVPRERLDPETDSVVSALKPGEYSDPYLTPYGWQIIALDSLSADSVALRRILMRVKMSPGTAGDVRDGVAAFLDLAGTVGFEELAAERGLRVDQLRPLVGDEPEVTGLDIVNPSAVVNWALRAKPGEVMPTAARGPGGYYVFQLVEHQAATLPEFEEVKRQAAWRVKQQRERELWTARAREVLDGIRAGRPLEEFAGEETGIELITEEYQNITDSRRRRGAEFAGAVKALDPGQVSGVVATNWGAFIIRVDRREPVPGFAADQRVQEMYQQTSQQVVREMLEPPAIEDYRDPLYY
ncbi:MAG TPA: peptidyl-prolyl cis-trans isomerase [candidate division WOR-3 bacterium]|uniref:Periplasmic chaperone PpiD n=1 Tax=candidate division WOR-3 bacterium TaxID=2052148 RepID=A0A7V0XF38_UNCW3|nr:peptidyl-prolyl cis-trans isomerase [candidate division WOR-3 bacterium]